MKGDLKINGKDAYDWGVNMGDGFIDALTEALTPKNYIENESRLEHGKRIVIPEKVMFASREITLDFTIEGDNPADFMQKKETFLNEVYKGLIKIQVPDVNEDVYKLVYKGKGSEYGMNPLRTFCRMMLKFEEPNPMNRGL